MKTNFFSNILNAFIRSLLIILIALIANSCLDHKDLPPPLDEDGGRIPHLMVDTVYQGIGIYWGMVRLPDGNVLLTEKSTGLWLFDTTTKTLNQVTHSIAGTETQGHGGWLDLCLHPNYAQNGWIYLVNCFNNGRIRLLRFRLQGNQVQEVATLMESIDRTSWYGHYGSRLAFGPDGKLYWSVGEGGSGSQGGANASNQNARNLGNLWGKVLRLNDDGSIPSDNPILQGLSSPGPIWSYGHRNPQGLVFDLSGRLWSTEHGPRGGDELNLIQKAGNYGWPTYSEGINYDGSLISNGHLAAGITAPTMFWIPSPAFCGLAVLHHPQWRAWRGQLLLGCLVDKKLRRMKLNGNTTLEETSLLDGFGRIRNVVCFPDGEVWVSVENPGRLVRVRAN